MSLRPWPLAALLLLACSPAPAPSEAGADAPPADATALDVPGDVVVEAAQDAALDAVAPETGAEPAPEPSPEPSLEGGVDAPLEAASDAAPDACGECGVGTFRCAPGGGSVLQRCAAVSGCGAWQTYTDCATAPGHPTDTCHIDACARLDPVTCPTGCGDGNCVLGGYCVYAGWTRCTATTECTRYWSLSVCRMNAAAGAMICDVPAVRRCSDDSMCAGGRRCNFNSGFCE